MRNAENVATDKAIPPATCYAEEGESLSVATVEKYDFSSMTIIPFCIHGGSRLGQSVDDIKKLCPKTKVLKGFSAFGNRVDEAANDVDTWQHALGVALVK